jgi:hypothetical protein
VRAWLRAAEGDVRVMYGQLLLQCQDTVGMAVHCTCSVC